MARELPQIHHEANAAVDQSPDHEQLPPLNLPAVDARGVKRAGALKNRLRARMSNANAQVIPKVSATDLKEIEHD